VISWKSFKKLKAGDIVLYNGKPRIVRKGPADGPILMRKGKERKGLTSVHFAIMRRSWTGRPRTSYNFHDCKDKLTLPRRKYTFADVCGQELDRLHTTKFSDERIVEEIHYVRREDKRLGRKTSRRVAMLRKKSENMLT
jgi:hypothetical protein